MKNKNVYIWSLGHSNFPIEIFLNKLREYKIGLLCDVRTFPVSRFCPHFNKNALQDTLAKANITYLYRGKNLGGRGINVGYDETIDELVDMARKGTRVCVMCAEKSFEKCHRYTVLTPSFEARGILIIHISYNNEQ